MLEIEKLGQKLTEANIPYERHDSDGIHGILGMEMKRIKYPQRERCVCSAIQGSYSYGGDENLIEIRGLTKNGEDIEGYLTAEDVFERISEHYKRSKEREQGYA